MGDLKLAHWRKSTRSNNGDDCVEVANNLPSVVMVRDSKDPTGPVLAFDSARRAEFVMDVKGGL